MASPDSPPSKSDLLLDAASGVAWMGGTTWQGRRAMRISVSDTSTTDDDVGRAVNAILVARSSSE